MKNITLLVFVLSSLILPALSMAKVEISTLKHKIARERAQLQWEIREKKFRKLISNDAKLAKMLRTAHELLIKKNINPYEFEYVFIKVPPDVVLMMSSRDYNCELRPAFFKGDADKLDCLQK